MNSFSPKRHTPVLWNLCKYKEKYIGQLDNINYNMEYGMYFFIFSSFFFFLRNEIRCVSLFWTINFILKRKNIYRVVLVLLRCRLRATQNSISAQVVLRFVTKRMIPKHETSPISWLPHTYSNLKISLCLATIIHPISAFSTLCLPHDYSIFPPTIW